ncbi:MAG TPA: hypothetical protein VMM84_19530 [Pyrinomonadaceae bacterium]|nr:hypothetical protein [Pyrinomonadaceae bacterium]
MTRTPSGLRLNPRGTTPSQGFKANPELKLANTFGVINNIPRFSNPTLQEVVLLGNTFGAQTEIPDEGALTSYGSSYNPANPGTTYSVDGVRVQLNNFIFMAGFQLQERFGLLEDAAHASAPALLNYEVWTNNGRTVTNFGLNEDRAIGEGLVTVEIRRYLSHELGC